MRHFTTLQLKSDKPWLIVGKGPTYDKIHQLNLSDYYVFGLNHVCNFTKCHIGHCIDIDVVSYEFVSGCEAVIMPWHPHYKFKSHPNTLNDWLLKNGYLQFLDNEQRLLFYDLSTWKGKPKSTPIIITQFFSGEAAFGILAYLGIKEIYSIGIDGGKTYASEFDHLSPLQNGQSNFDKQFKNIEKIIDKHKIRYKAL